MDRRYLDAFAALCWEEGTLGVQEVEDPGGATAQAYFSSSQSARVLADKLKADSDALGLDIESITADTVAADPESWLLKWKSGFTSFPIGKSFFVHPSWEPPSPSHRVNLLLEPGQAFGTGTHESTQLCLLALEQLPFEPATLLDVGTGSGILAIAAARLFMRCSLVGLDVDPTAVEMAKQNLALNAVRRVRVVAGGIEAISTGFELVLANLTLPIFRETAAEIERVSQKELIVSGFTCEQRPAVVELFSGFGLRPIDRWDLRGWSCVAFSRDPE